MRACLVKPLLLKDLRLSKGLTISHHTVCDFKCHGAEQQRRCAWCVCVVRGAPLRLPFSSMLATTSLKPLLTRPHSRHMKDMTKHHAMMKP